MFSPNDMVEKIFKRLDLIYGPAFKRFLLSHDYDEVKAVWAEVLAFYADHPECIAWALEHLPEHCPNVIEFRNLCRQAPENKPPVLPEPAVQIDERKVAANRKKLAELMQQFRQAASEPFDKHAWARRIVGKFNDGQEVSYYGLNFACEVLGLSAAQLREQRLNERVCV